MLPLPVDVINHNTPVPGSSPQCFGRPAYPDEIRSQLSFADEHKHRGKTGSQQLHHMFIKEDMYEAVSHATFYTWPCCGSPVFI